MASPYSEAMPAVRVPDLRPDSPHTRDNGLRVVLAPDRRSPVVGVGVLYDVGFRSEPEGRTGFAHLFEHLMFQGSANLEKLEHFRYVQSSGGIFNGSTHLDYTNYFEALPSHALERGLFLEADRMRSPRITEENLANQIDVVKEEIRVNVLNRPYGGFPWLMLPEVHVSTPFPTPTTATAVSRTSQTPRWPTPAGFFDSYYAPANAVLASPATSTPDDAMALIEHHFGDLRKRQEAGPAQLRRAAAGPEAAGAAPRPHGADAGGRDRLPGPRPGADLHVYLATVLLAELLSDGDASRLHRVAGPVASAWSPTSAPTSATFGDPLEERDPTRLNITAHYYRRRVDRRGHRRDRRRAGPAGHRRHRDRASLTGSGCGSPPSSRGSWTR